jgi:hypothetical protein
MGYKWGKFQGVICLLIGCFLLYAAGFRASEIESVQILAVWLGALLFCATGIGLLAKTRFGVVLVWVMLATALLLPLTGHKPRYPEGYLFHAAGVLFWGLPALFYYPKRWKGFRRQDHAGPGSPK